MVDSGLRSSWEASLTSRCWAALAAFESDEHGVHRRGKVGDLLARSGHRHTLLKVGARDRRHLSTNGFHRPQRRSHQPIGAHDHQTMMSGEPTASRAATLVTTDSTGSRSAPTRIVTMPPGTAAARADTQ